jgi:hypothetical protein
VEAGLFVHVWSASFSVAEARVARANNIQDYFPAELDLPPKADGTPYRIFRPEAEVFAKDAIKCGDSGDGVSQSGRSRPDRPDKGRYNLSGRVRRNVCGVQLIAHSTGRAIVGQPNFKRDYRSARWRCRTLAGFEHILIGLDIFWTSNVSMLTGVGSRSFLALSERRTA